MIIESSYLILRIITHGFSQTFPQIPKCINHAASYITARHGVTTLHPLSERPSYPTFRCPVSLTKTHSVQKSGDHQLGCSQNPVNNGISTTFPSTGEFSGIQNDSLGNILLHESWNAQSWENLSSTPKSQSVSVPSRDFYLSEGRPRPTSDADLCWCGNHHRLDGAKTL